MKLALTKTNFIDNFLNPVSKLAENLLLDFEGDSTVKTFVSSADNSTILIAKVPCRVKESSKAVVPDCKTFQRLFSNIDKDELLLEFETNHIVYKDSSMSFKYHLLDESYIVNKKSISEEKVEKLSFDTTFEITKQKLSEIIKFNSIVPDAEKLYFFTEDKKVFAKIGDDQKANTNEITCELSEEYKGESLETALPLNIQNILLFSFNSSTIRVSVNKSLKIFKFENDYLKYIVSGLVK